MEQLNHRLTRLAALATDADLVFDPSRLADEPLLVDDMNAAGFLYSGRSGIWHRTVPQTDRPDHVVPVGLVVPKEIASTTGRRGARLPAGHGKTAAQKAPGVEGTLVDNDLIEIGALDILFATLRRVDHLAPCRCFTLPVGARSAGCVRLAVSNQGLQYRSGTTNCPKSGTAKLGAVATLVSWTRRRFHETTFVASSSQATRTATPPGWEP